VSDEQGQKGLYIDPDIRCSEQFLQLVDDYGNSRRLGRHGRRQGRQRLRPRAELHHPPSGRSQRRHDPGRDQRRFAAAGWADNHQKRRVDQPGETCRHCLVASEERVCVVDAIGPKPFIGTQSASASERVRNNEQGRVLS
jgi:hypothetical protein